MCRYFEATKAPRRHTIQTQMQYSLPTENNFNSNSLSPNPLVAPHLLANDHQPRKLHVESHLEPLFHSTVQNAPLNLTTNPNIIPTNPQFPSLVQYNIPTHFEDKASPQVEGNVRSLGPRDSRLTR